jgi:PAS domain S-box-containing protein
VSEEYSQNEPQEPGAEDVDSLADAFELDGEIADDFRPGTTGFLVVDSSLTVIGSAGITGRLSDLVVTRPDHEQPVLHSDIADQVTATAREAFETEEPADHELTTEPDERLVVRALPIGDVAVLQLWDLTEYAGLARELKRTRQTLDTLEDGVYTLDEAFVITSMNDAVAEITGYSRDELVGSHASKLAGDETLSMATEIIEQLRGSDVGLIESSIQSASGESIPIETRFSTVEFANGDRRRVGVFRDIRERRQHEHTLGALNRSARTLLRAEDRETVSETIVEVARTVWPDATVVAYGFDKDDSQLVPVAAAGTESAPAGPGTEQWEAFATGTAVVSKGDGELYISEETQGDDPETEPTGRVIQREEDDDAAEDTLFASLEEYGLLQIDFGADTSPSSATESVELLAANAVAALGRVEREAELSRRREALAEQNTQLEQAREFNDLLRQINGALVEAESLEDIAKEVCNHLAGSDRISLAWFGETYRSGDGLEPVARAGAADGYLDGLSVVGADPRDATAGENAEPTLRALGSQSLAIVSDVSAGLHGSDWRERALVRGFQSIASVPIQYSDLSYGVLSVYANQPGAFDGILGDLLDDLGETIGNAINSLETKRSLQSESHVELGLEIADPETLSSRLAAALGESIEIDGVVPGDGDGSILYLRSEADPTGLIDAVLAVEAVRPLGDADDPRSAVTVTDRTVIDRLADYSADVERLRADASGIELIAILPRSADVRQVVEALETRYANVELQTRKERATGTDGPSELATSVSQTLTDRQHEALRTAYLGGYFEWPRASTGEEVAESLGITQPTFNRHLRTTERKLFSLLFDE